MKFTPSALISTLSGSTGGAVASRWKGIQYIRRRVTPSNPRSADQIAQRNAFTIIVKGWQGFVDEDSAQWNLYASGTGRSGFNWFSAMNVKQERTDQWQRIMPPNRHVDPPTAFAAVTGIGVAGDIDVSWTDPAIASSVMRVYTREVYAEPGTLIGTSDVAPLVFDSETVATAGAVVVGGLDIAKTYEVYGFIVDPTLIPATGDAKGAGEGEYIHAVAPKAV